MAQPVGRAQSATSPRPPKTAQDRPRPPKTAQDRPDRPRPTSTWLNQQIWVSTCNTSFKLFLTSKTHSISKRFVSVVHWQMVRCLTKLKAGQQSGQGHHFYVVFLKKGDFCVSWGSLSNGDPCWPLRQQKWPLSPVASLTQLWELKICTKAWSWIERMLLRDNRSSSDTT